MQVGTLFFILGCSAACMQAANPYSSQQLKDCHPKRCQNHLKLSAWKASIASIAVEEPSHTQSQHQPVSWRWVPAATDQLHHKTAYWGCAMQLLGLLFFLVAIVVGFLGTHSMSSHRVELWLLDVGLLLGCMCFVAGAYLLAHSGVWHPILGTLWLILLRVSVIDDLFFSRCVHLAPVTSLCFSGLLQDRGCVR